MALAASDLAITENKFQDHDPGSSYLGRRQGLRLSNVRSHIGTRRERFEKPLLSPLVDKVRMPTIRKHSHYRPISKF